MAVGAALIALAGTTTMRAQGATTNDGIHTEEQAAAALSGEDEALKAIMVAPRP
jgi:hypothetical protein